MSALLGHITRCHLLRTLPKPRRADYSSGLGGKRADQSQDQGKKASVPQPEQGSSRLKQPISIYMQHMPRYEMFKSRLDKLNPEVPAINKTQADDALISFFALVTGTPIARMRELAENGFQGRLPSNGLKWKSCKVLWKDSEEWWKENGGS